MTFFTSQLTVNLPRGSMTRWASGSTLAKAVFWRGSWEFLSSGVTVRWQWSIRGMWATYFANTVWASARQLQHHSQKSWIWRRIRCQKTDKMSNSKRWDMTTEAWWVAMPSSHCPLDLTWHSQPTYFLDFLATMDLLTGKQRSTCYATSEVQLTWASLSWSAMIQT